MSAVETPQDAVQEEQPPPTEPAAAGTRKRPRLDLGGSAGRERKRGKSMFGLLVGTLNKAKIEDKERNASEAAKKRQLIEQRLQNKLRKETDSVRRAEEAKKDKMVANRKEEELQLKDSIYKHRRIRLPLLSNFLVTSDNIPSDDSPLESTNNTNPLALPPRSHPPPLYYLPVILTPAQDAFLARRKAEVAEATANEWDLFREERTAGLAEITQLRQRVAEEAARRKTDSEEVLNDDMDTDAPPAVSAPAPSSDPAPTPATVTATATAEEEAPAAPVPAESEMEGVVEQKEPENVRKEEPADDDDAVEY